MSAIELHNGNCLDIMPTLEAGSVDMVLADPPYGTTACKWDSVIPFEPMWAGIKHAAKRNAAIVMMASQPFTSALVMSNPKMFRHDWIWDKMHSRGHLVAKKRPMARHEHVLVFQATGCSYRPQMIPLEKPQKGRKYASSSSAILPYSQVNDANCSIADKITRTHKYPSTIQSVRRDGKLHPTQKPVALMEYLIRTYTNEGDTVLDFTMGSGTTGVACANTGRNFIGIELDAGYFEIAEKRIYDARGMA